MSSSEAAEYIGECLIKDDAKWNKVMCLAYWALQRQIPKRPLQACGHATERFRESIPMMNYCPICGQRIDWKGEDDGNESEHV